VNVDETSVTLAVSCVVVTVMSQFDVLSTAEIVMPLITVVD
jgi:hypothetical protein